MPVGQVRYQPEPGNQGILPGSGQGAATGTFLFTIGPNAFLNAGTVVVGDTVTGVSLAAHGIVIGNGTTAPLSLAPGAAGHIATSNGTDWTSAAAPVPTPWQVPLVSAKTGASVAIAAAPAAGTFGITSGFITGDHEFLYTETANSSTVTDVAVFEVNYPTGFPASGTVNVVVNCNYVLGAGTIGTHTVACGIYTLANDGTLTQIGGTVQALPSAAGDVTFPFTGINPGLLLRLAITLVVQDTGGHAVTGQINGVRLST